MYTTSAGSLCYSHTVILPAWSEPHTISSKLLKLPNIRLVGFGAVGGVHRFKAELAYLPVKMIIWIGYAHL